MTDKEREVIEDVCNDFETEGCDGMGTVTIEEMNKLRSLVDFVLLNDDGTLTEQLR